MIELFEFIRTSKIHRLIEYIVLKHLDKFSEVDYVSTFKDLSDCYEQNKRYRALGADSTPLLSNSDSSGSWVKNALGDEFEEAYFSDSDDDGKMTANGIESTSGGLVTSKHSPLCFPSCKHALLCLPLGP
jgi:hypothetical protein